MALFMFSLLQLEAVLDYTACVNLPRCRFNKGRTIINCSVSGLTSIPDIPATALALDLSRNRILRIPVRAFSKLSELQKLDLRSNFKIAVEPLAFEGLESLTNIKLSRNYISTIPTRALAKLPQLQRLDLAYNRIQSIGPLAFEGLESLTVIDLRGNIIEIIPTQALSNLSNLQSLYLSYNKIQSVEPPAFAGQENLKAIDLSLNYTNTIPTRAFSMLSQLQLLDLGNNRIQLIEPFAFDKLQSLKTINLSRNAIRTLGSKCFAYITRLDSLDLSVNGIREIAADAFVGTQSISEMNFKGNLLSEVPSIGSQPRLSRLDLSDNQIVNATFPSTYLSSYNNLSVDLSKNGIGTLDRFTFSTVAGISIVDMDLTFNNISSVGPDTFDPFASIESLLIGYNPLSIESLRNIANGLIRTQVTFINLKSVFLTEDLLIDGLSAFMNLGIRLVMCPYFKSEATFEEVRNLTIIQLTKEDLFQFSELNFTGKQNVVVMDLAENRFSSFPMNLPASLESLDLDGNQIQYVYEDSISYLGSLEVLMLQQNSMYSIWPGTFYGLGSLQMLFLSQNQLGSFCWDIFEPLQNLTHLYLGKNELHDWTYTGSFYPLVSLRVLDLSDNGCETVADHFFESFPSLQILNLIGNNLGKFVFQSDGGERLFRGLTKLEEMFISNNRINNLPDFVLRDQVSLKLLDISNNQISGWGPNMFKSARNIEKLDISFNLISVLMEDNLHDLGNLQELNLKGNPFICNCDLLWFREWIDSTSVALPDKESYTCHGPDEWRGKPVLEFTKEKINCSIVLTIVGSVTASFVISFISVIFVYKNRWRLRLRIYLLSKRGRLFTGNIRGREHMANYGAINDDGHQDYYDAYISCSDRDYDWALHHLLPGIDNGRYDDDMFGGDFKLYFDPRDKEPGKVYTPNNTCRLGMPNLHILYTCMFSKLSYLD